MVKVSEKAVPTALHATLFLARMLARGGNFPVEYLAGFQQLMDDIIDSAPEDEYSLNQSADLRQEVLQIISDARSKAEL